MPIKQPKKLKLLIFSDIHFGKFACFPEFSINGNGVLHPITNAVQADHHLVKTVKSLGSRPDAILILGDLTSIASPAEFVGSVKMVKKIADSLGISTDKVFYTFGNHDVDWRICSLGDAATDFQKDELYNHVAASLGALFVNNPASIKPGPLPGSGVVAEEDFTLFIANSGFHCTSDQEYRHGKIGAKQLEWLESEFSKNTNMTGWRVLMVHHHPFNYPYPTYSPDISTLADGSELIDLVGKHQIDFVCHGHRHHPKIKTQFESTWNRPATFFCAGSLAVNETHRNKGQIPNLFHIVNFENRLQTGGAYGHIQTFEFASSEGWRPIMNTSETPLDHLHYFGSLLTETEFEKHVELFLNTIAAKIPNGYTGSHLLPAHVDLPEELKCCTLEKLNKTIREMAPKVGCRVIGKYPDDVGINRI
jgi:3',5'-cyclic AMP phosphodiesterase CpdA